MTDEPEVDRKAVHTLTRHSESARGVRRASCVVAAPPVLDVLDALVRVGDVGVAP